MKLITNMKMLQPFQIILTGPDLIDGLPCYINNTPMTVHGFNLVFHYYLLIAKIYIVLNRRFKYGALIIFRMINPLQLPQSQKTAQLLGINLISFVGTAVDQGVLPGVRGDDFGYIRSGYLGSPIGKITLFQCQILLFGFNSFEGLDNLVLGCGKSSVTNKTSLKIHVAKDTMTSVYIYSQICYLFHRTTSFVVYFGFWGKTLYTPRSSVFHLTRRQEKEKRREKRERVITKARKLENRKKN